MTETDEQIPGLLLAADHLEWWAESLPRRSEGDGEPWYEFLERRYRAEIALIKRLRRAPHCWLETCPMRMDVELTLGGISVHTKDGLAAALREWARRAREQGRATSRSPGEPGLVREEQDRSGGGSSLVMSGHGRGGDLDGPPHDDT